MELGLSLAAKKKPKTILGVLNQAFIHYPAGCTAYATGCEAYVCIQDV